MWAFKSNMVLENKLLLSQYLQHACTSSICGAGETEPTSTQQGRFLVLFLVLLILFLVVQLVYCVCNRESGALCSFK